MKQVLLNGMEVGWAGLRALTTQLSRLPAHSMGVYVFPFAGVSFYDMLGVQTNRILSAIFT